MNKFTYSHVHLTDSRSLDQEFHHSLNNTIAVNVTFSGFTATLFTLSKRKTISHNFSETTKQFSIAQKESLALKLSIQTLKRLFNTSHIVLITDFLPNWKSLPN